MSNSSWHDPWENAYEVDDAEAEGVEAPEPRLIRCSTCHGSGLEIVHGFESDCIDCEGNGWVEV